MTAHQQKPSDLIDAIIDDHREVQNYFEYIEETDDTSVRRRFVEQVIIALMDHSVAEELHLYPTARRLLPDGDKVADLLPTLRNACDAAAPLGTGQAAGQQDLGSRRWNDRPHGRRTQRSQQLSA